MIWWDESVRCDVSGFRPKTGFQLWLEENRKSITAGQPDLEETDVIREAMGRFRVLSAQERLVPPTFTTFGLKRQRAVLTEQLSVRNSTFFLRRLKSRAVSAWL